MATRARRLLRSVASVLLHISRSGFLGFVACFAGILAFSLSLGGAILLIRVLVRSETYLSPAPEGALSELVVGVAALAAGYGCAELTFRAAELEDNGRRAVRRILRKCLLWFVTGLLFASLVTFATATPP